MSFDWTKLTHVNRLAELLLSLALCETVGASVPQLLDDTCKVLSPQNQGELNRNSSSSSTHGERQEKLKFRSPEATAKRSREKDGGIGSLPVDDGRLPLLLTEREIALAKERDEIGSDEDSAVDGGTETELEEEIDDFYGQPIESQVIKRPKQNSKATSKRFFPYSVSHGQSTLESRESHVLEAVVASFKSGSLTPAVSHELSASHDRKHSQGRKAASASLQKDLVSTNQKSSRPEPFPPKLAEVVTKRKEITSHRCSNFSRIFEVQRHTPTNGSAWNLVARGIARNLDKLRRGAVTTGGAFDGEALGAWLVSRFLHLPDISDFESILSTAIATIAESTEVAATSHLTEWIAVLRCLVPAAPVYVLAAGAHIINKLGENEKEAEMRDIVASESVLLVDLCLLKLLDHALNDEVFITLEERLIERNFASVTSFLHANANSIVDDNVEPACPIDVSLSLISSQLAQRRAVLGDDVIGALMQYAHRACQGFAVARRDILSCDHATFTVENEKRT